MSLFAIAAKGGWLMLVLAAMSLVAVTIIIERYLKYKKTEKLEQAFWKDLENLMNADEFNEIKQLCNKYDTCGSVMVKKGLDALPLGMGKITQSLEFAAKTEINKLEKGLGSLSTIAAVAPLVGFLGTVTGMVKVFMKIGNEGVDIEKLAGGIWEALLTTVGGLIVGIIAIVCYNWLISKLEGLNLLLEEESKSFLLEVEGLKNETK